MIGNSILNSAMRIAKHIAEENQIKNTMAVALKTPVILNNPYKVTKKTMSDIWSVSKEFSRPLVQEISSKLKSPPTQAFDS